MTLFKDILKDGETLFKNPIALDFDYTPKKFMYREREQELMASCIKPLLKKKNGRNLIITGKPGIGKTLACKKVLEALETEDIPDAEQVDSFYINCWKRSTSYKIILELCEKVNYRFTQNKNTEDLFNILKGILNKKNCVFVFDEIDKVEDFDFLYMILEDIYRKSIFLITNNREFSLSLDKRIKSRLIPEIVNFKAYNLNEVNGILTERMKSAFYDVWDIYAFEHLVKKTYELEDIRSGLFLMKCAGEIAESNSLKKINKEHVEKSIEKLDSFFIKSSESLEDESKFIFNLIKKNKKEIKIGDLHKIYLNEGGKAAYRTFQRKIKELEQNKFISVKKIHTHDGTTSIISCNTTKKITDF